MNYALYGRDRMRLRTLLCGFVALVLSVPSAAAQEPVAEFQAFLVERGCDVSTADGSWGRRTTAAAEVFASNAGVAIERPVTKELLAQLRATDVRCPRSTTYKLATKQTVDFGGRLEFGYILDVFDVNGDGADDFAMSGQTYVTGKENVRNEKLISSFLVQNGTKGKFRMIDLGDGGLTRRTWDARFLRGPSGETLLALGRDGELGLPHTSKGEVTSIFKIGQDGDDVSASKVYEVADPGTTSSVDSCDIDQDGFPEIYVNNNGGKQSQEQLAPHMVTVRGDEFVESYAYRWLQATDRNGSYNDVAFADINGDGACDFLAAIEAEKEGGESAEYTTITTNDRIASYVVFNKNGSFSGERVDLPNPYFGENTAAFYITTVRFGAERLIALTTAEFRGHHIGFRKFVFQLYAYRNGKFVEVTEDLVSGKIDTDEANQAKIQVLDLDSDGDDDIYFGRYARAIQVYLNDGRRFVRKEIAVSLPKGQKAVAFLRTPASVCPELTVLHVSARLYRFSCAFR
jgi:hypothetical protein